MALKGSIKTGMNAILILVIFFIGLFISGIQIPEQFVLIKSTISEEIYIAKLQNKLLVIMYFVILLVLIAKKEYYAICYLFPLKKKRTYLWIVGVLTTVVLIQHHPFSFHLLPLDFFEYMQLLIIITIITPIYEELMFRGLLILVPPKKFSYPMLIISSVVFASFHPNFWDALILGIALGILAIRFRNLLVPIIAHSLWNLFAIFY